MVNGYANFLLRVNLSEKTINKESLPESFLNKYIGGSGLGIRIAYDEIPPNSDPLGLESKIIFATGPITNTAFGTAGRFQVVFKSPLTGMLCDSSSGGFWGAEMKSAGYDVIIIEGKSDQPIFLLIQDNFVSIESATHLWGKDAYETIDIFQKQSTFDGAKILTIGPAGENLVPYSCMINDSGRTPGRGGTGAVMGSKNLKAIVIKGTQQISLSDPVGFKKFAVGLNKTNATTDGIANLREYGTAEVMDNAWPVSDIPVKNWSIGSYEDLTTSLGGKKMKETILVPHVGCYKCPIGCSRWVKIDNEKYKMDAAGPEYESLGALGTMCLIEDLEAVSYAAHLCNIYGLDTISCGSSIAFAMECYEKGILTKKDTDGIDLSWGNQDALIEIINKVAYKDGIGDLIGKGTKKMGEILGGGSIDFAVQVKGLEAPMHDPRAFFSWATTYATGPRGACHLHGMSGVFEDSDDPMIEWDISGRYPRHSDEGKAKIARMAQNWSHLLDSLVICYFASFTIKPSDMAILLKLSTGYEYSTKDLFTIGERINALHRSYNYLCGIRKEDDKLPKRMLEPLQNGGAAGKVPDLKKQLDEYYEIRRWDDTGRPNYDLLVELDLQDVAKDLYKW